MAATEYTIEQDVQDAIDEIRDDDEFEEFEPLRLHDIKFVAIVRTCADSNGEHVQGAGDILQLKKISALHKALINADYILQVDYYGWNHVLEGPKLTAAIHRCLMSVNIVQSDSDRGFKIEKRKPDVMDYRKTVERFGTYTQGLSELRDLFKKGSKQFAHEMAHGEEDDYGNHE